MKRAFAFFLNLVMVLTLLLPAQQAVHAAQEHPAADSGIVVDDTQTDRTGKHYFTYTEATDPTGHRGWAADTKDSIPGDVCAKTQHWVWDTDAAEAGKHTYTFTFEGTGVEIYGVKNDPRNVFQLDQNTPETVSITGNGQTPVVLYGKQNLPFGKHVVSASLPQGEGTGLQVCYARVYGAQAETGTEPAGIALTIPHNKTTGTGNKFSYSADWTISDKHSWSNRGTKDEIWYQVEFIGNAIDVYSGKNNPMGMVEYFLDGESMGKFSLFRNGNIDETFITRFSGLDEGPHVFRAVATGERDGSLSTNTLIDAAKVIVYHAPYPVTEAQVSPAALELPEGRTQQLQLTLTPEYAGLEDVIFTSEKEQVASVTPEGLVEAVGAGSTNILICAKQSNAQVAVVPVTVLETAASMGGSIVDVDTQYTQDRYDQVAAANRRSAELTAWRNDKAISEIALISRDCALKQVTLQATAPTGSAGTIPAENVRLTFIKSTTAYAGGYPGYGGGDSRKNNLPPQGSRQESSDILYQTTPISVGFNRVQPVWVEIYVPRDTPAGDYTTQITVTADGLETPLTFTYTLHVQNAVLKDAAEFRNSFDIELWQYPYSVAEYYQVEPFSQAHLEILRPHMELYRDLGGHAITATILEDAWDGQTYSKNPDIHYPSMIRWEKKNGVMTYDYTDFDRWVELNRELGIGDKIVLYSVAPWHGCFTYWENGQLIRERYQAGNARYNAVWTDFLTNLMAHVTEKGWFDACYIGIDERGFSDAAFDVIESVTNAQGKCFKTAGAINNFQSHRQIAMRVTDINVGDNCVVGANEAAFDAFLKERQALGLRTTLYTCTEHVPGNFSLSAPVESYWSVINAGEKTAGMLRWAYDAWVEDPLRDTTHNAFEPGDCFLVFPDVRDAENPVTKSSVRLERMAQGVRDINKLRQMVAEYPDMQADVDALYEEMVTQARVVSGGRLLSAQELNQVIADTHGFRQGIDRLTEKYLDPQAHGGFEYDRVISSEITQAKADSETKPAKGSDGPAEFAFDGNPATHWHTNYDSGMQTNCPHWISWKVGEPKRIGKIVYTARTGSTNGIWKKFTVQGRNGDGPWMDLAVDVTASGSKTVIFEPQTVTELRVTIRESHGDRINTFASAAEIETYAATAVSRISASRQALRDRYADVREKNLLPFTDDSLAALNAALTSVRNVLNDPNSTDRQVAQADQVLTDALNGLKADLTKLAEQVPDNGHSVGTPFPNQGEQGFISDNIRIPGIITLNNEPNGLAACADARWNHHGDHGNIDGLFSISHDGGATWEYSFPQFFNDTANVFHDYSATLMDPVLAQGEDGRLYLLIDAFPGGHALSGAAPLHPSNDSGFVTVAGKRRLAVYTEPAGQTNENYAYYVGDFAPNAKWNRKLAPLYAKGTESNAMYYVDEWFNLYNAKQEIMVCMQLGSDKYVQQNLFYYHADLHVRSATYLWLNTSDDNGKTWSAPQLLDPVNRPSGYSFYGVGPGAGLSFVDTEGTNVIVMPTYVNPNERSGFVYSTDRGQTWTSAPNVSFGSSESCIVQLDGSTVRKFTRSGATRVQYADYTWNAEQKTFTPGPAVEIPGTAKTANNEVSAVRYPGTVQGKQVFLVSTATGSNRGHGHIYTLTLESDGTMGVFHDYAVTDGNYDYHYSSLTVKPDGDIALFYEDNFGGPGWGAGGTSHHTYLNISRDLLGLSEDQLDRDQELHLQVGQKYEATVYGTVSSNTDPQVVEAVTVPITETRIIGQTGTDSQYRGAKYPLDSALFTFTEKNGEQNVYTVRSGNVYLGWGNQAANLPCTGTPIDIYVKMQGDAFTLREGANETGGRWLWFWKNREDRHFDRNSRYAQDTCDFDLFRPAEPGERTPEIDGFVKLTGLAELHSGGQYLIAAKANDNQYYVLRPVITGNKYNQVLRVVGTEETTVGYQLTLTGKQAGQSTVLVGGVTYQVQVTDPAVQDVIAKIDAIGPVSPEKEAAIREARRAYDALTRMQQSLVTNYQDLVRAEEALAQKQIAVAGTNMTLGNELSMNFMVRKSDVSDLTGLSLQITKTFSDGRENVVVTVPARSWKDYNKDYYAVKFTDISAKEMTDDITAVVLKDGKPAGKVYTESVEKYALRILRGKQATAQLKAVIVDMLNYGAEAQKYFKYHLDVPANARLTAAEQALASRPVEVQNVQVKGDRYFGSNLNLGNSMTMTVYFKGITPDMHAVISYTKHTGEKKEIPVNGADFVRYNDTVYGIRVSTLVVADAQQPVTVTVYDAANHVAGSGVDSIASYVARSSTVGELGQAILKLASSAETYFANR